MQIWISLKNDVYLHKVKGGQRCPPFFCDLSPENFL